ncbi:(S)-benzoin forming benzil reductase [Lentibacillus saliphilus]|uniref:(S)-benzoin forming benzil reductase n=1 Tax=Lentibacillus saliphilus TaxID=2737028 RepID=UPI001C30949E|nr:(S)-benzoin forming benzil reductase [Lentibacillus saliphilus]
MHVAIVTGVSRGLGAATAQLLMENGTHVIGISRKTNVKLKETAHLNHVSFTHFQCDLADVSAIEETFTKISSYLTEHHVQRFDLINNAGVVEPIHQSMHIDNADLQNHVMINTVAPMALMNMSLKYATDHDVAFNGVTVTSGAAERPVYGWSAYCSTKASMNMYTKTVALEQEALGTQHNVFAFSPGIMDTDMQTDIRQTSKAAFIERDTFRDYKEQGMLRTPKEVASVLVDILGDAARIENGHIYNVRDYI